jgi:hypothetical protein
MLQSRALALVCLVVVLAGTAASALASHYPIDAAPFIEDEHKTKFTQSKLFGTEELLNALLTPQARKELGRKTGIKKDVLLGYVQACDLLRVRGVGPKMARLLILSGVDGIKALRAQKSEELMPKMQEANQKHGVSELLPQLDTLKDWIHQARKLKIIVK